MKQIIIFVITVMLASSCGSIAKKDHTAEHGRVPLLSLVFDDGNDTDYLVAREVLIKQGVAASFAVVTGWIGKKNYMTVSQLLDLQRDGFEIMSHTVSHPNLNSLDEKEIESEFSASKATLEGWGLRVNNLTYPYNKNNDLARELAGKYYRSGRGGRSMLNLAVAERYELKSYSFGHNTARMKELVDIASAEGKWLIFYLHKMDDKVKTSHGNGDFWPGEELLFSPSGARGRYRKELFNRFYFIPLSGTPQSGDTVTGQSSSATCYIDEIFYNGKEALKELIDYVRSRHPAMRIVTINKGLDIYNVK